MGCFKQNEPDVGSKDDVDVDGFFMFDAAVGPFVAACGWSLIAGEFGSPTLGDAPNPWVATSTNWAQEVSQ